MDNRLNIINKKLEELSHSKFRSSFHLNSKMLSYLDQKGYLIIKEHAHEFVLKNLAPAYPKNDGHQTPMKNHPVFIAQHACACCCRNCLFKWYHIDKGKYLSDNEVDLIVMVLISWIKREINK